MKRVNHFISLLLIIILLICATSTSYAAEVSVSRVQGVSAVPDATSVMVTFKKISNVSGYKVYISEKSNSGYKCAETINAPDRSLVFINDLKPNRKYFVKVRAYKTSNGKKIYGKYSSTVSFITKYSSPSYAGMYLAYAETPYSVTLYIENSNYSHDLDVNLNSAFLYDVNTKSVVCGLSFSDYATSDTLASGAPLLDYFSSNYVVAPGHDCYFHFEQSMTKLNVNSNRYGIAYLVSYNGSEYLARTDSTGTYFVPLYWENAF